MSRENQIREGLVILGQTIETLSNATIDIPAPATNSISGNAIHGGKVTLFRSTGIADNASKLVLLVDDDGITIDAVDTERLVGDTTVTGNLTVEGKVTAEAVITEQRHVGSIDFHAPGSELDMVGLQWRTNDDKTKQFVWREKNKGFYASNTIDLHRTAHFSIDNINVLSSDRLGPTVQHSELRSVGVLENLTTVGDLIIDEGFVRWDSGTMRFSIGNELPNGQFSVSSNEAEFVVDPWFDTVKVGTYTTSHLDIITDDTIRISIKDTGNVNVIGKLGINAENVTSDVDLQVDGPVRIQNKKIEYGTDYPVSGSHGKGDIVYNTNPVVGGFVGWICVESGMPGIWKPFGRIEDAN